MNQDIQLRERLSPSVRNQQQADHKKISDLPSLPQENPSTLTLNLPDDDESSEVETDTGFVEFNLGYDSINKSETNVAKLVKNGRLDSESQRKNELSAKDEVAQLYKREVSHTYYHPEEDLANKPKPFITENDTKKDADTSLISESDDEWREMEAGAGYDVYDEKGELMVKAEEDIDGDRPVDGFMAGYTRISAEQEAELYKKFDKRTDFLFQQRHRGEQKDHSDLYNETIDVNETEIAIDDFNNESQSALTQLQTTKIMLQDLEKFAYVGLVKLVMNEMATELALSALVKQPSSSRSKFIKRLNLSQTSFGQWQLKMISRLYSHLDFSKEEIVMIENLVSHSIDAKDLSKSLKKSEIIDNPVYEPDTGSTDTTVFQTEENSRKTVNADDIKGISKIEIDVAWTVICDLFLVLLADSVYDSRSRTLLLRFARLIDINNVEVCQFERRVTDAFQLEEGSEQVWDEKDLLKKRRRATRRKKLMYVGLATIGGSLVLGLSGGLLGPVIGAGFAAGLTTIGISGTSGFLAGAGGTALVTLASTAIGAHIGYGGMKRRVGDVKTFEFVPLHNNKRVNLIITVSGWINSKVDDIRLPFSTVDPIMGDLISLLWEPDILQSTGQSISIVASEVITQSIQQILGATILVGLMSAIQLPMALSKLSYILDNPWNVSLDRAWKAGLIMADTLISRNLGVRPVTLIGFSLGSRVIYSCLLELAKRGAFGLVEKVIIFGSPFVVKADKLTLARSVVSGEFINGYSKKDWILGYLFRATGGGLRSVVGLSPIEGVENIQNFDCTEFVKGHMEYRKAMPKLLKELGVQVLAEEFVEIDEPDPETTEKTRKLILEFDEAAKQFQKDQASGKKKTFWNKIFKPRKKDWWEYYYANSINSDNNESRDNEVKEAVENIKNMQDFDVDLMMDAVDTIKKNMNDNIVNDHSTSRSLSTLNLAPDVETLNFQEDHDDDSVASQNSKSDFIENGTVSSTRKISKESTVIPEISYLDDEEEFSREEHITMTFA